jgi:hypothetical protein
MAWRLAPIAASMAAAASAASCYEPRFADGLPCSPLGECPAGQACRSGVCSSEPAVPLADATAAPDAAISPPPDAALGAFSEPIAIAELSPAGKLSRHPSLTSDELEIFFSLVNNGQRDLYTSRRPSRADAWAAPAPVAELNSLLDDQSAYVSRDGLSIWFASTRLTGGVTHQLFLASRPDRQSKWQAPQLQAQFAAALLPSVTADGLTLTFARRDATGNMRPHQATRAAARSAWSAPVVLGLDTPGRDVVIMSSDGLTAVLTSDRAGGPGAPSRVYLVRRGTIDSAFGAPEDLGVTNELVDDLDGWISDDLRTLYFASNRGGERKLYVASR